MAIAGWAQGTRAEFLVADAFGVRLGRVGLGMDGDGTAEVGYWFSPQARRRGLATSAVRAVCRWAFTAAQVQMVLWQAEVGNVASRRVAEKSGFFIEAALRGRLRHRGSLVDAWVGSLLPDELT